MPSRLAALVAVLLLAGCSSNLAYWGRTPQHVRDQLSAADRLMARDEVGEARALFDQAAGTGHPEALIRAGRAWLKEPGADPERARRLFETAWTRNSARRDQAGVWLARTIADDEPDQAMAILETIVARGEPRAAADLAELLAERQPDDPRIEDLLRRAAAEGDLGALLTLARDYGDAAAAARAVVVLQASHAQGDAYAANHLAKLYAADGPLPDPALEVAWLKRAAERGHASAMLNYGRALVAGDVVTRDPERGIAWIRRAAEADNHWAQLELGRRLARGDGIERDPEAARSWLEKAAAQDNPRAEEALTAL